MASNKVDAVMATRLSLDTTETRRQLSVLRRSVGVITTSWKNQYAALQDAGKGMEATVAKVNGMNDALTRQNEYISELTKKQNRLTEVAQNQDKEEADLRSKISATRKEMEAEAEANSKQTDTYKQLRRQLSEYKLDLRDVEHVGSQLMSNTRSLSNAKARQSGMSAQLKEAKQELSHYNSGLRQLQDTERESSKSAQTHIERLRAEGKTLRANHAQFEEYRRSLSNVKDQLKAQREELTNLTQAYGKDSSQVREQRMAMERTRTQIAQTKNAFKSLRSSVRSQPVEKLREMQSALNALHRPVERLRPSFQSLTRAEDQARAGASRLHQQLINIGAGVNSRLRGVFAGTLLGNLGASAIGGGLSRITQGIGAMTLAGEKFNREQQTMNASWLTLTGNATKGKEMVDMTNQLAVAAQNSTEMVNTLNQRFYSVTNRVDETRALSHAVLTLQDAFHVSDAAIDNFSTQWSQMVGNGKASAQDMLSIQNVFPRFREELLKYEQQVTHNKNLTMAQMNQMMSKGKISSQAMNHVLISMGEEYKNATNNFTNTLDGMTRTIKAMGPRLTGDMTASLAQAENPIYHAVSDWVSDPDTETEFKELGSKLGNAVGTIASTLGGSSDENDIENRLDALVNGIGDHIDHLAKLIQDNAGTIRASLSLIRATFGTTYQIVISTIRGVVAVINAFLSASGQATASTQNMSAMLQNLTEFISNLGNAYQRVIDDITDGIKNHPQAVQASLNAIRSLWTGTLQIAQSAFSAVVALLSSIDQALFGTQSASDQVANGLNGVAGIITKVSNVISNALNTIAGQIRQHPEMVASAINTIKTLFENISTIVGTAVQDIMKVFAVFAGGANQSTKGAKLVSAGFQGIANVSTIVANTITNAMNTITSVITSNSQAIKGAFGVAWNGIKLGAKVVLQIINDVIGALGHLTGTSGKPAQTMNSLSEALKKLSENRSAIKAIANTLITMFAVKKALDFAVGLANVITAIKKIKDAITVVRDAMAALDIASMANPVGLVIGAIAIAIAGFVELYRHSAKFRKIIQDLWKIVKQVVTKIIQFLIGEFKIILKLYELSNPVYFIMKIAPILIRLFRSLFTRLIKFVRNQITRVVGFFTKTLPKGIRGAKSKLGGAVDHVKSAFDRLSSKAKTTAIAVGNYLKANLPRYIRASRKANQKEIDGIKNIFGGLRNFVKDVINSIIKFFTKTLPNSIKGAVKNIKGAVNDVKHALSGVSASKKPKKYATGTGTTSDQMALVNDASGANFRELMVYNGHIIPFPNKRNILTYIPAGASIINGDVAKQFADNHGLNHYANGTDDNSQISGTLAGFVDSMNQNGAEMHSAERDAFLKQLNTEYDKQLRSLRAQIAKLQQQLEKAKATLQKALKKAGEAFRKAMADARYALNKAVSNANYQYSKKAQSANKQYSRKMRSYNEQLTKASKKKTGAKEAMQEVREKMSDASQDLADAMADAVHDRNEKLADAKHNNAEKTGEATQKQNESIAQARETFSETNATLTRQIALANKNISRLADWRQDNLNQFDQAVATYANGGFASKASIFGEAGPEMAIPMDSMKQGRAWQLMQRLVDFYAGSHSSSVNDEENSHNDLSNSKLDKVIDLLTMLVGAQQTQNGLAQRQIQATRGITGYDRQKAMENTSEDLISNFRNALLN